MINYNGLSIARTAAGKFVPFREGQMIENWAMERKSSNLSMNDQSCREYIL